MTKPKNITEFSSQWSLADLLPNGPKQLGEVFEQIESHVKNIESFRPQLSDAFPINEFSYLLRLIESLHELTARVAGYAYLNFAQDTQDQAGLSLRDRIQQLLAEVNNRVMFFSLWFKSLDEHQANKYIAACGELKYYLELLQRYKRYTLSEAEEKIINLKDINGWDALVKLYEIITNGFVFKLEVDGDLKELTRDGLTHYYHHPSPVVRAATYQELFRVYGEHHTVLAQIYTHLVRDWGSEGVNIRGYSSPMSIRNYGNSIPDTVVDALLDACRQNAGLFQSYFKLKALLLGMDKLRRYDIYAPIVCTEKTIELKEAIPLVLDCFHEFSPQMAENAYQVLEHQHLDAEVRPGKRSGAFSYSPSPSLLPWVLVNFNRQIRDVTTLAHELGHSVHSMLASNHSILTFHPPLPLAETASVFAEMLVTDRLLKQEPDPSVQRDLLMTILDDAYATVERQAFISIFERDAHAKIAESSTSQELADLYWLNLQAQFGDSLELSEEFSWEWLTIPHIYNTPFYTYAYSFGQLLVLSLYQQYLEQGQDFIPRYIKLLSHGGSADPQEILEEAGLKISSPEFWQGGFNLLQIKLEQLEQIIGGLP